MDDSLVNCQDCPLSPTMNQVLSFREGDSWREVSLKRLYPIVRDWPNQIVFVGDYPHLKDIGAKQPRIFSGNTIILIKREFASHGIEVKTENFVTALQCHVNKKPQKKWNRAKKEMVVNDDVTVIGNKEITKALKACRPDIEHIIKLKQPKLIIPFGDVALRQILKSSGIGKHRGKLVWSEEFNCWVFPMFHPLMVELDQANLPFFRADVAQVCQFIKDDFTPKTLEKSEIYQDVDSIRFILDKKNIVVALDTETQGKDWCDPNSEVISYSISDEVGRGYNIWLNREVETEEESTHHIWWERKAKITNEKGKSRTITQPTKIYIQRDPLFEQKVGELRELCLRPDIKIIMMNGNYDIHRFMQLGIKREEIKGYQLDIQTGMHTLDPDNFKNASLLDIQRVLLPSRQDHKTAFGNEVDKGDMLKAAKENPDRHTAYACLSKQSGVRLADGSIMPISFIVNKKLPVKVQSLNLETGKIEIKQVTNWYRVKHSDPIKWLIIHTAVNGKGTKSKPYAVYTPDHRILTESRGWVSVENLLIGEKVATPYNKLSSDARQVILGSILGDGRIERRNKGKSATFKMGHCEKQVEYLDWKCSAIKHLLGSSRVELHKEERSIIMGRKVHRTDFYTRHTHNHPELTYLHDVAYQGNGIAVVGDWVEELNLLGLAVWYQDDGTFVKSCSSARIYTLAFTEEEVSYFIKVIKQNFGIEAGMYFESKNKKPVLTFNVENTKRLFSLITKYIHPTMRYKVSPEFRDVPFVGPLNNISNGVFYTPVQKIEEKHYSNKMRGYKYVSYCLDVEDNHNFLTWGEVVHNCADTDSTLECGYSVIRKLKEDELLRRYYRELVHPVETEVMMDIERNGMLFDLEKLPQVREEVAHLINTQEKEIIQLIPKAVRDMHREKGLRLSRTDLLRDALFSKKGFGLKPLELTPNGSPTLGRKVLYQLWENLPEEHPAKEMLFLIMERGPYTKLYTTYLKGFERSCRADGKFHMQISKRGTGTGRTSARNPNLQQVPKRNKAISNLIRNLIYVPDGYTLVCADQSQSELRFIAHESLDAEFLRVYRNGEDIHTSTANMLIRMQGKDPSTISKEEASGARTKAKAVNFGLSFSMLPKKFKIYCKTEYNLDISLEEAEAFHAGFFEHYKALPYWHKRRIEEAKRNGGVRSLFGFFRHLPNINSTDFMSRISDEHAAVNSSVQSESNDWVLYGLLTAKRRGILDNSRASLCCFVHDEAIVKVQNDYLIEFIPKLIDCMENPPVKETFGFELAVPMKSEFTIGSTLGNQHEMEE